MTTDDQNAPPSVPNPLRIPVDTLRTVEAVVALLVPLTDKQRGFVIRLLVQMVLPESELPR